MRRTKRPMEVIRHRGNTGVKVFTLLVALLCCLYLSIVTHPDYYHPSPSVSRLISLYCNIYDVKPSLVEAVMLTESKFDEKAVSHVGAVGMMQLMPDTAEWISNESGLPASELENPEQNIPLGIWYIRFLLDKYEQNEVLALAAYNAGRGNVDEWMREWGWTTGFTNVSKIPFPETREFVKSVLDAEARMDEKRKG
ncbi:MAG: lytic transglycosylase domain-containing protein [Dialister sp.]|nr:lytic transglycosylase domain-containing protein [Dialister sp.]